MNVAFRVDASTEMGTGHVMRCLTLADHLTEHGHKCHFISRKQSGDLLKLVRSRGHVVHPLSELNSSINRIGQPYIPHATWLGCSWERDAEETSNVIRQLDVQWLVLDHYGIDKLWEQALKNRSERLLVIDDLADREHDCDVLVDQNLGRRPEHYHGLVTAETCCLIGPEYALLRPEFSKLREVARNHLTRKKIRRLLVTMGGSDPFDLTSQALRDIDRSTHLDSDEVTVIMGTSAVHYDKVLALASRMSQPCHVRNNISNMAEEMLSADLAIGSAGTTTWERCCMGLPAILAAYAENQKGILDALVLEGGALPAEQIEQARYDFLKPLNKILKDQKIISRMSERSQEVCDGRGVFRLYEEVFAET